MNDYRNNPATHDDSADKLLDRVLQSVHEESVPEFPESQLLDRCDGDKDEPRTNPLKAHTQARSRTTRLRYVGLVIAGAIAFLATFFFWPQDNRSAFARMQAALEKVRSISYSVMDYHANGDKWETKVNIVEPDLSRSEQIKIGGGRVTNGLQIANWADNIRLMIDRSTKKATFCETEPHEALAFRRNQFIEKLRNVSDHATKELGPVIFDERPCHAFMVMLGDREFKVTADDDTFLPVHMEYEQPADGFREVFQDFVFDGEVDLSLFELKAPEGYEIVRMALEEPPKDAELLVVSPTLGLGGLPFGSNVESVIEFLGESSSRSDSPRSVALHYNSRGLIVRFGAIFSEPGGQPESDFGMTSIGCLCQLRSGNWVRDFAGRTAEGIEIGSSMEELVDAYGDPEWSDGEDVIYVRRGITFYLLEDKVCGFDITEPVPDEIEIIVNDDGIFQRVRQND